MPDMNIFAHTLTNKEGFRDKTIQNKKNSQPNGMTKTHVDKPYLQLS